MKKKVTEMYNSMKSIKYRLDQIQNNTKPIDEDALIDKIRGLQKRIDDQNTVIQDFQDLFSQQNSVIEELRTQISVNATSKQRSYKEKIDTRCNNYIYVCNLQAKIPELFTLSDINDQLVHFPKHTTYGIDYFPPEILNNEKIRSMVSLKIFMTLCQSWGGIDSDLLKGRLIIMTKTDSPIWNMKKTRPIAVQTLPIRVIEKIIKDPHNSDMLDYFSKDTDIFYDDVSSLIIYYTIELVCFDCVETIC